MGRKDGAQEAAEAQVIPRERQFVHLHLHTEYSLLDGGNRVDKLVKRVRDLGMDTVGVTDHGNLFGAVSFYEKAKAAGVKPILGCEAYVAPGSRHDRTYTGVMDGGYHLVLLAESDAGWKNLMRLASRAYLEGFYYKPRIDRELLEEWSDGLVAINGHLGSELAFHMVEYEKTKRDEHYERAVEVAKWHAQTFKPGPKGPRFYVELQHHIDEQNVINPHLIRLAEELDLPLVATNDAHFLKAEDHDAHDTLICISTGKIKSDENRMRYPSELYVKSPEEMRSAFEGTYGDIGRIACDNTVEIGERCEVEMAYGNHAPVVRVAKPKKQRAFKGEKDLTAWYKAFCADYDVLPFEAGADGLTEDDLKVECDSALRELCEAGLIWRYGGAFSAGATTPKDKGEQQRMEEIRARLERELGILADKGISAYFLIVWDFVNWGRQRGIPANARGSGVGTMVGYLLGLSNACPVEYGLLFERFTDPDRSEYPDIDIDLCQNGRADVINYVREKYGHVAQIITFGTLKARAAIRDVGRVLDLSLPEVDRIAKLVPETLNITLDGALEEEPDLRKLYESEPSVQRVIDTARTLEGQARHASVHAAGVIVATRPLEELAPLYKQSTSDDVITQWDGPTCERIGLLKMDFLGLRTLSIIERAKRLIREGLPEDAIRRAVGWNDEQEGDPLDLERLTFDDPKVFDLFQRADTTGVFQFESGGMRRLLLEMKPDRLEDLIAANALFRPGPMDLIPDYNRRKHGREQVPKQHEIVDRFTAETYGVMVYQEQVMQIVHELGGIPLRAAYSLIKAISKKKVKVIDANRAKFIEGAAEKGLATTDAENLFDLILKFAGYGFNKSHSTGYAIVAYQTAYLKTYFPKQYMAAFLTFESQAQKVSDWIPYLEDCRRTRLPNGDVGIEVRPPDVNRSDADFSVVFEKDEPRDPLHGHVRFGLKAIKGVGAKAIDGIIAERVERGRFESLHDFTERVPMGVVNKSTIESLVKCGAMDELHGRDGRASMVASIEGAVRAAQTKQADERAGQGALFGGGEAPEEPAPVHLERAPAWSEAEALANEKDTLGFYVSSHPLEEWRHWASIFTTARVADIASLKQDQRIVIAAMVQSARTTVTRSGRYAGEKMAIVTIEDDAGVCDAVLFAEVYAKHGHLLDSDKPIFVLGRVDHSRGDGQVMVDRLAPIDGAPLHGGRLRVVLHENRLNGDTSERLTTLRALVASHEDTAPDTTPLDIAICAKGMWATLRPETDIKVRLDPALANDATLILGERSLRLVGGMSVENLRQNGSKYARKGEKAGTSA